MRVLVLGASGFIGARIAAAADRAGWHVRAGARDPRSAARRAPQFAWVRAEFAELLDPASWAPLLEGVDAVVNCVGVLQDGAGASSRIAHLQGPSALIEACRQSGVRRLVHLSAAGADDAAGTAYARDKHQADLRIQDSDLDWIVVRPSLVIAREVYGGTALIRGLAGFPMIVPVVGGAQVVRPLPVEDLAALIVGAIDLKAPARRTIEAEGPESISLAALISAYRGWLGFPPAPIMRIPPWMARPVLALGDAAGWLGWPSALRTTSLRQLDYGAAGRGPPLPNTRGVTAFLASEPAGVQDRWQARLYFVRPISVVLLAVVWLVSGFVALGPGSEAAEALLRQAGFASRSSGITLATSWLDVAIGALILVRRFTRVGALASLSVAFVYVAFGTVLSPGLWIDPLGPLVKVAAVIGLSLFVAATEDRR